MAWLQLRDRVIINSDELVSIEARASDGMSHHGKKTNDQLQVLANLCFRMSDGSEFVRFFIPAAVLSPIMEELMLMLGGSRERILVDALLAKYGIRPEDTY